MVLVEDLADAAGAIGQGVDGGELGDLASQGGQHPPPKAMKLQQTQVKDRLPALRLPVSQPVGEDHQDQKDAQR